MKCEDCGEEMIEHELVDLGYGQRHVQYECPFNCEYVKWLEEQCIISSGVKEDLMK